MSQEDEDVGLMSNNSDVVAIEVIRCHTYPTTINKQLNTKQKKNKQNQPHIAATKRIPSPINLMTASKEQR